VQPVAPVQPVGNSSEIDELRNRVVELQRQLEESMNLIEELSNKDGKK
jgi:hypothetical protein